MSKQTAVTLLFEEFRALSEAKRKAGDEQSANLIDFLCEREDVAKAVEREQIIIAFCEGYDHDGESYDDAETSYYNRTYKGGEQ